MLNYFHFVLRRRKDLDVFPVNLYNYITHLATALKKKADAVSNRPFFKFIILFIYFQSEHGFSSSCLLTYMQMHLASLLQENLIGGLTECCFIYLP